MRRFCGAGDSLLRAARGMQHSWAGAAGSLLRAARTMRHGWALQEGEPRFWEVFGSGSAVLVAYLAGYLTTPVRIGTAVVLSVLAAVAIWRFRVWQRREKFGSLIGFERTSVLGIITVIAASSPRTSCTSTCGDTRVSRRKHAPSRPARLLRSARPLPLRRVPRRPGARRRFSPFTPPPVATVLPRPTRSWVHDDEPGARIAAGRRADAGLLLVRPRDVPAFRLLPEAP